MLVLPRDFDARLSVVYGVTGVVLFSGPAVGADAGRARHLHQRRRADPAAIVCDVSQTRPVRPDVTDDIRGGASVGALDQVAGHRSGDATLAHR